MKNPKTDLTGFRATNKKREGRLWDLPFLFLIAVPIAIYNYFQAQERYTLKQPPWIWIGLAGLFALGNLYQFDSRKKLEAKYREERKATTAAANQTAHNNYASGIKVGYILHAKGADKDTVQTIINEWPATTHLNTFLSK